MDLIALEEHYGCTDPNLIEQDAVYFRPEDWPAARRHMFDIQDERLTGMDAAGIEKCVLSQAGPALQMPYAPSEAIELGIRLNDYLAEQIARRPDRFAGFAMLPLHDPDKSVEELTRCVKDLGFRGAMVHGFSMEDDNTAVYLDDPRFDDLWAQVAGLDVPVYLHPREPLPTQARIYDGHPWLLGSAWAFGVETATHAMRLMGSGLFDQHPSLQIILGHLGEMLPAAMWRFDHRARIEGRGLSVQRTFQHYLTHNLHVTTSGNFHTPALMSTITEMSADRVMFSIDYPFEAMDEGPRWFDGVELNAIDKRKIGSENARKLLRL